MASLKSKPPKTRPAKPYQHPESESPMRPEVGTQAQFKKKLPPKTYRYDSSLSPALDWDGQNSAREQGEALIRQISEARTLEEAKSAASKLAALSKPFLNWAGKAERLSFDVPTMPLFIHERLSTKAILETLKGHRFDRNQTSMLDLWGDPQHSVTDQILRAYEHKDKWVNRMILGDSLVVMNSLLNYESLGGQVQMIYMDPPYGVKFGSNFQPFVRKRDVSHNDDEDMTREPEMVQAYRDTWELNLHSYLTYLRDRLLLARELLAPSGSIFVQISDENLHHVREVMDDVFGKEHFCSVIPFVKMGMQTSDLLGTVNDYLLWYAKDKSRAKYRKVFTPKALGTEDAEQYCYVETPDSIRRRMKEDEQRNPTLLPAGSKAWLPSPLISDGWSEGGSQPFEFEGQVFQISTKHHWKTSMEGLRTLASKGRLIVVGNTLRYIRYLSDFPVTALSNLWSDTAASGYDEARLYVVQTNKKVVERCLLMATDPGDLALDPTCGSGTTAYVAEQWGRRWITIDTSRVPLALARQRLLTATFPWYQLKDELRGPGAGFIYARKLNKKGEDVGGIVPHITLKSIANNEPPEEEVLVDRPEENSSITRVTGPFCFEATIPTAHDFEEISTDSPTPSAQTQLSFVDRMLEILRKSPVLRLERNKTVTLKNVRPPAKTLSLSAEAIISNGSDQPVAFVFGPENGAVSESLVYPAAKEANAKNYAHLYVVGFAIQPNARELIEKSAEAVGIPATYVQATPDLMMGDLLKNMRSSQIFSVCGLPEIKILYVAARVKGETQKFMVELLGLDVFDPIEMKNEKRKGNDVPAWFLDTDYNGLCFHVSQAFFPRTGAWESLKKALRGEYEESVWDHLAGSTSAPFEAGAHNQIAVKVIDDRGNELMVVSNLSEAK